MNTLVIAGAGVTVILCALLLLLNSAKKLGASLERENLDLKSALETKRQADVMVERITPRDVVGKLRTKATNKRGGSAKGKR